MDLDLDAVKESDFPKLLEYARFVAGKVATLQTETTEGKAKFKKLADERDALRAKAARADKLAEHYGIEDDADLDKLPKPSGDAAAEAAKQYEVKFKRQDRELSELRDKLAESVGRSRKERERAVTAEAISKHEFTDGVKPYLMSHVGTRLVWESDDDAPLYKADDGKLISVHDALAGIAKATPDMLKPTGTGGAGFRQSNAGSGGRDLSHLSPVERINAARAAKAA